MPLYIWLYYFRDPFASQMYPLGLIGVPRAWGGFTLPSRALHVKQKKPRYMSFVQAFLILQGHQPRMPDYVKLFLRDAKEHRFEINFLLKSIDWRFLYQNFINLCQIVCLLHRFEVTASFSPQNRFPIAIQWQYIFELLSFLNDLSYRYEIGLDLKIIWCSFRKDHFVV